MPVHEVVENDQEIRRGEGIVFSLTTTNWQAAPTPAAITIVRLADNSNVTATWTSTATPTVLGNVITLPEITVPSNAELGRYRVNIPFTAGGFSPGVPYVDLVVGA
jgi:hypothetical protein